MTIEFNCGCMWVYDYYRRKFRSQTSDNMDRWKSRGGKRQRREERRGEEKRREEKRREKVRRKKMQVRERVEKLRRIVFLLAKAAGAEPFGQMRDENFHAVVARSTFGSKNVQNTSFSDRFWKLRCRKSARHCGAKHMSKSKCAKHTNVGALLEVDMSKKCPPLWREAHFEVKMYKAH